MHGYKWYVIIFLVLMVIAQPNFNEWFVIKGIAISFVLFFIMLTAFGKKRLDVFIMAFSIGIIYDLLYSPWFGRMTIVLLLAVLSVMAVGKIVYKENMPVLTLYFFSATYLLENARTLLEVGPKIYYNSFSFIQGSMFGMSIYAAALAAFFGTIFYLQSFIKDRRLGARKSGIL